MQINELSEEEKEQSAKYRNMYRHVILPEIQQIKLDTSIDVYNHITLVIQQEIKKYKSDGLEHSALVAQILLDKIREHL